MSDNNANQYPTFKARWVMGSPFTLKTTDHNQKPEPNEDKHHWFVGFAVPKGAEWDQLWAHMRNVAANDPTCTAALCDQPGFNWKIEDADAPDNPQNKGKDSYPAGHMIIKFTRYKVVGPAAIVDGNYTQITNPNAVKRGDYFYISASTKFNGAATVKTNAGMYQNLDGIMFAGAGEAIISETAFDARQAFGNVQGAAVSGAAASSGPATSGPATSGPASSPEPAHDLVAPGGDEEPPIIEEEPPVVEEEKYLVRGKVYTRDQLLAMPGWTEAHLAKLQRA